MCAVFFLIINKKVINMSKSAATLTIKQEVLPTQQYKKQTTCIKVKPFIYTV